MLVHETISFLFWQWFLVTSWLKIVPIYNRLMCLLLLFFKRESWRHLTPWKYWCIIDWFGFFVFLSSVRVEGISPSLFLSLSLSGSCFVFCLFLQLDLSQVATHFITGLSKTHHADKKTLILCLSRVFSGNNIYHGSLHVFVCSTLFLSTPCNDLVICPHLHFWYHVT